MATRKKARFSITERENIQRWVEINSKLDHIIGKQEDFCKRLETVTKTVTVHCDADTLYQKHMTMILTGDPADETKVGIVGRLKILETEKKRWDKATWFMVSTVIALAVTKAFEWIKFAFTQVPALPK